MKHKQIFKNKSLPILLLSVTIGTICWLINLLGFVLITLTDKISLLLKALNNLVLDVSTCNLIDGYKELFSRLIKK